MSKDITHKYLGGMCCHVVTHGLIKNKLNNNNKSADCDAVI